MSCEVCCSGILSYTHWLQGLHGEPIEIILGLYWDSGKENANCYLGLRGNI